MTTLRVVSLGLPASEMGPENPLPVFRQRRNEDIVAGPMLTRDERLYLGWEIGRRVLPYRMQDEYSRTLKPRTFQSVVLENEILSACFLPELGGRLISLFHKPSGRELLDRNPVLQVANLALRDAWFSGGIEWNVSQFGHHYLTCSPVFAARIAGARGEPALRLYEWDRVKRFPWQIDFHLPPGSHWLLARVRLVNPHAATLPMYWWTNMAVPETPGVRVLAPADSAIGHVPPNRLDGLDLAADGAAPSFAQRASMAKEYFFRLAETERRWVAAVNPDGRGFIQSSTDRLRGRKVFYWGMNTGGRRWQEFLGGAGHAYLEIQAGLARTQLESVPMPGGQEWTWTEAFGSIECDPRVADGAALSWAEAQATVGAELESRLPRASLEAWDGELAGVAVRGPEEILFSGSGWGALERRRLRRMRQPDGIPAEWVFDDRTLGDEQKPWIQLLESGALPGLLPEDIPPSWMTDAGWSDWLETHLKKGLGDHWLAWLHLGNMRCEALDVDGARQAWETSLNRQPSLWAWRNLAVLESRAGRKRGAVDCLARACELAPPLAALAVERAAVLAECGVWGEVRDFIAALPESLRRNERLALFDARAALEMGDLAAVERALACDWATVREGDRTLSDLWFGLQERRLAALEGIPINDAMRERVRIAYPPPSRIDFRMS